MLLLSALSKTLSTFLVLTLIGLTVTFAANHTVFDNTYDKKQLADANSYQRLSAALNQEITKNASQQGSEDTAAMTATLQKILTPAVLEQKITQTIDGLHAYYYGDGPLPTIDLTDLASQVEASGIPLPKDTKLDKPITFGANAQLKDVNKTFGGTHSAVIAVLLAAGILVLSWKRGKWGALPNTLIVAGVLVALLAAVFGAVARALTQPKTIQDAASNPFAALGRDLAAPIMHDLTWYVGAGAAILLVVGIVSRIVAARLHPQSVGAPLGIAPKPSRPAKPAAPTFVK